MPNVDLVKIAIIIVLLAVMLLLLAHLLGLEVGASTGRKAWEQLNTNPQTPSAPLTWNPLSVATELMQPLFARMGGSGLPVSFLGIIRTTFTAAFVAVFIVLLIKVIIRVVGS